MFLLDYGKMSILNLKNYVYTEGVNADLMAFI